jgi:two-component system, response regulator
LTSASELPPVAQNTQQVEILLVEDNPHDVKLAMRAFTRHKLQNTVQVVRDGAAAIDALMANVEHSTALPKLVLLDLKLPKVDGIEVLRRIRAHPVLHPIPVVLLTTSRESRDIEQGYELGCNSYIVKPLDFKEFTEAIQTLGLYWLVLNTPPQVSNGEDGSDAKYSGT